MGLFIHKVVYARYDVSWIIGKMDFKEHGLEVNGKQNRWSYFQNMEQNCNINIANKPDEYVDKLKYLGIK
jgi:hypothetical protein